jgi:hypothetical protein
MILLIGGSAKTTFLEVAMRHQTLDQLQTVAEVAGDPPRVPMTREQRLRRWAELLEQLKDQLVMALSGTEYQPPAMRDIMRSHGSALAVAADDPILRAEGLKDDTYGETKRFFEVSDWQLHRIVCHCHVGAKMPAYRAAHMVRKLISPWRIGGWVRGLLSTSRG